jgi:hypothetical protein
MPEDGILEKNLTVHFHNIVYLTACFLFGYHQVEIDTYHITKWTTIVEL